MFLYITLFFQNVLGFSPFEAGLRSLPVTGLIGLVSPMSGRLTERVPVRLLLGTGLAFVTVGQALMGNLSDSSAACRRRQGGGRLAARVRDGLQHDRAGERRRGGGGLRGGLCTGAVARLRDRRQPGGGSARAGAGAGRGA
jgi:hypothetical protein